MKIDRDLNGTLALLSKISIPISLSSHSAGHGVATFTVTLHDGNGKQLDSQTKSVDVRGSNQSQSFDNYRALRRGYRPAPAPGRPGRRMPRCRRSP